MKSRQKTQAQQIRKNIVLSWVGIYPIMRNLNKTGIYPTLSTIRKQIPLVAANGMTINKSQGSSFENVVVTTTKQNALRRTFLTRERLYVACSRATSLRGLFVNGEFRPPNPPKENDPVTNELQGMKAHPIIFSMKHFEDFPQSTKQFFVNVQSFLLHKQDLEADFNIMSSDLIALVEPHLLVTDEFSFPNFTPIYRHNCSNARNSEGILLLQSNTSNINVS